MKYFIYCILAIVACCFFLPKSGTTEIRNLPVLVFILALIAIYFIYRFVRLVILISRVRAKLKKRGMHIRKTRFFLNKGCIIAEAENEVFNVSLLVRKKSYYRYHFENENKIEFYKSSFSVYKSSRRGTIAQGAVEQRLVGKQKIFRTSFSTNKPVTNFTVIDKLPYRISDSVSKQELGNGDNICSSDVVLFDINGFMQ